MEEKRNLAIFGGEEESDDTCKRRRTHTWKRRGS
jgi:hypothetical protein